MVLSQMIIGKTSKFHCDQRGEYHLERAYLLQQLTSKEVMAGIGRDVIDNASFSTLLVRVAACIRKGKPRAIGRVNPEL